MNGPASDPAHDVDRLRAAVSAARAPELDLPLPRFLAALDAVRPEVLTRFADLGFDPATAEATLADVPRKVAAYGVEIETSWLLGLARADVVACGRLQFERVADADGHAVHLPESAPLDDASVDAAFASAASVLGATAFNCQSWMLDSLLPAALGPDSGIVRFARRFQVEAAERDEAADRTVAKFVFRRPLAEVLNPAAVQPRTRLQRFVAAHLRSGEHWSEPKGSLVHLPFDA